MAITHLSKRQITFFQKEILKWYAENKRDLPWRKTRDPYRVLISEVMLQQTQVSRVIPKYEAWMKAFPDVESLSHAKTSDVLRLWSGLGYNRRALYLKKTAEALGELRIKNYESREEQKNEDYWPRTIGELMKLPGIGKYTAGAVVCFAFDEQIAVVDTNIRKVILTKFISNQPKRHPGGSETTDRISRDSITSLRSFQNDKQGLSEKEVQEMADQLLPRGRAYEWNQALMDYASAMLKKEKILIAKQSKFIGSDRYYRGKLLRLLLKKRRILLSQVGRELKDDFTSEQSAWLERILFGMEKDGLIVREKKHVLLRDS